MGAIRVDTLDELAATLLLFANGRRAGSGGLVSIHDSGGERGMIIDLADRVGVPFAAIGDGAKAAIAARLDPGLEAANPLDAWGTGADFVPHFETCFDALLADPEAGIGLFGADLRDGYYLHRGFADAALGAAAKTEKPVAIATNYSGVRNGALALELTLAGMPVLDGTWNALVAVRGAFAHRDFLARPTEAAPPPPLAGDGERERWRLRLSGHRAVASASGTADPTCVMLRSAEGASRSTQDRGASFGTQASPAPRDDAVVGTPHSAAACLDEAASLALLAAWGIPAIPHALADTEQAARAAADGLGWPVALKTAAPGILHKSDLGGVVLNIRDAAPFHAAYGDLASRLGPRVLVARMAPCGVELSLGMVCDPQFGPIVTVGAGGTLVALLDDRVAALAPFGSATARRLLDRLRLRRLLDGFRGGPAVDLDRLAGVVAAFSVLAADLADFVLEIDVNPLIAGPEILALDALVVTRT